jgi:hypothetical protein
VAPFGPGFTIEKQRIEVTYSNDAPDRVTIRGWYQMKNTGTQPLENMRLQLPSEKELPPQNVRAEWSGKSVAVPPGPDEKGIVQVGFGTRWSQGEREDFVVSYDLETPIAKSATPSQGGAVFLPSGGWYPVLMAPHGDFSSGGAPPAKWELIVTLPKGYYIHSSGHEHGQDRTGKKNGAEISLRFEQIPLTDFSPFVVAGPYVEQVVKSTTGTAVLWTYHPVAPERANKIGDLVSTDAAYFSAEFGSDPNDRQTTWIIECAEGSLRSAQTLLLSREGCLTVPHSVVVPPDVFSADPPEGFREAADAQLIATLFRISHPILRGDPGLPASYAGDYAAFAYATFHDPASRTTTVRTLLNRFDANSPATAKPLLRVSNDDPEPVRTRARVQSELFFIALEDRCGVANLHHALARELRIFRGQALGISDLRSAVEAECGADLADFFRQWLNRPNIPVDFRARYAESPKAASKQPGEK